MKASRPYLIRALYEWIVDNQGTPYLLVDATFPNVKVPKEHVNNGNIVLNITPAAVEDLQMTNTHVSFSARFARGHFECFVPIPAALAIYANENGKGMFFSEEDLGDEGSVVLAASSEKTDNSKTAGGEGAAQKGKPHLTLVKS